VISWSPSLWEGLELVEHATGCRSTSLFDRLFPCPAGAGAYLMRFVGQDPLYADGEKLRAAGDVAGARRLHSQYVSKYPLSMAGHFVLGLEAFEQRDWAQAEASYSLLERYFPNHLAILYNRALALEELKFYDEAVVRLQRIVDREPSNYAALIHLYSTHEKAGRPGRAREVLAAMKRLFPNDASVDRLLSAAK
jgi:tetratricopeptide (TPR) repeat protein